MKIACPGCAAEYEVPAERMKPGRSVRCSRCDTVWKPAQEADPVAPQQPPDPPAAEPEPVMPPAPAVTAPAVTAMERLAASPSQPPRRVGLLAAWLLSVLVLAGAGITTVIWRETVIRVWPPSGRILLLLDPSHQQSAVKPGAKPQ